MTEKLYNVTVTVSYTENTDIEAESREEAKERLEYFVKDDIKNNTIDIRAFDVESESELVE